MKSLNDKRYAAKGFYVGLEYRGSYLLNFESGEVYFSSGGCQYRQIETPIVNLSQSKEFFLNLVSELFRRNIAPVYKPGNAVYHVNSNGELECDK